MRAFLVTIEFMGTKDNYIVVAEDITKVWDNMKHDPHALRMEINEEHITCIKRVDTGATRII